MDWKVVSMVGLGGALGSIGRYLLAGWTTRADFPTGILTVNVLGCFLIGVVLFGGLAGGWLATPARMFLAVGILGGFTTMSTFTYDTFALLESAEHLRALSYVLLTVGLCLAATWVGRSVGLLLWAGGS